MEIALIDHMSSVAENEKNIDLHPKPLGTNTDFASSDCIQPATRGRKDEQ